MDLRISPLPFWQLQAEPFGHASTTLLRHAFRARLNYVASAFDPVSRRLLVRATVENSDGVLKPGMFASVTLFSDSDPSEVHTPAVSTQRRNLRG
jgi:multidrug efflux pump subunit AcrA (membrane-fusion protein)